MAVGSVCRWGASLGEARRVPMEQGSKARPCRGPTTAVGVGRRCTWSPQPDVSLSDGRRERLLYRMGLAVRASRPPSPGREVLVDITWCASSLEGAEDRGSVARSTRNCRVPSRRTLARFHVKHRRTQQRRSVGKDEPSNRERARGRRSGCARPIESGLQLPEPRDLSNLQRCRLAIRARARDDVSRGTRSVG